MIEKRKLTVGYVTLMLHVLISFAFNTFAGEGGRPVLRLYVGDDEPSCEAALETPPIPVEPIFSPRAKQVEATIMVLEMYRSDLQKQAVNKNILGMTVDCNTLKQIIDLTSPRSSLFDRDLTWDLEHAGFGQAIIELIAFSDKINEIQSILKTAAPDWTRIRTIVTLIVPDESLEPR